VTGFHFEGQRGTTLFSRFVTATHKTAQRCQFASIEKRNGGGSKLASWPLSTGGQEISGRNHERSRIAVSEGAAAIMATTTDREGAMHGGGDRDLRQMLDDRRRELMQEVRGRICDARSDITKDREVLDEGESSEVDNQEDIAFALIQMKADTLHTIDVALRRLKDVNAYGALANEGRLCSRTPHAKFTRCVPAEGGSRSQGVQCATSAATTFSCVEVETPAKTWPKVSTSIERLSISSC
jgi:hypothetical protein